MPSYCDLALAKQQLSLSDDNPDDADDITLLGAIDAEISRTFELKTGREAGFGGTASDEARTIDGAAGGRSDVLSLPTPVRSVSGVAITGSYSETLDPGDWILWHVNQWGEAMAIKRVDYGAFPRRNGIDRVTVTGVWSDAAPGDSVPDAITDAVTFVTVETFRQRKSSPTGEIGPEGFTIRPRNPWNFVTVQETIRRYAVPRAAVF